MRIIDYYNYAASAVLIALSLVCIISTRGRVVTDSDPLGGQSASEKYGKLLTVFSLLSILTGCILLLAFQKQVPNGMNHDEGSIGYEAYALFKYGTDRYGNPWPIYPITYGVGGGSPVLIYLNAIATALFGKSIVVLRRVCSVSGCISIPLFGVMFGRLSASARYTERLKFAAAVFIMALAPWHIVMCRWSVDPNIMPMFQILAVLAFMKAVRSRKKILFLAAGAVNGFCMYVYGSATVIMPLYLIAASAVLILSSKKEDRREMMTGIAIGIAGFIIVFLPLAVFYAINYLDLPEIRLPFMTFEKFTGNRLARVFIFGSENFWSIFKGNIIIFFRYMTTGYEDGELTSFLPGYATGYRFTFPLTLIGFSSMIITTVKGIRNREHTDCLNEIMTISMFAAAALFSLFINPTIKRMILLFVPLTAFTAEGLWRVFAARKYIGYAAVLIILLGGLSFTKDYFLKYNTIVEQRIEFMPGFTDACGCADELILEKGGTGKVYCTYENIDCLYLLRMYQSGMSPAEYLEGVVYDLRPELEFRIAKELGNYIFRLPEDVNSGEMPPEEMADKYTKDVFIVNEWETYKFDSEYFYSIQFDAFSVVTSK